MTCERHLFTRLASGIGWQGTKFWLRRVNGNAIIVSTQLFAALSHMADGDIADPIVSARALYRVVAERKANARNLVGARCDCRRTGLLLATGVTPVELQEQVRDMFSAEAELAEYVDRPRGVYRVAAFVKGRLEGCLFVGPAQATPQWDAVKALLGADTIGDGERRMPLSGRATDGIAETGPLVCACFGVGLMAIRKAIVSGDASNVEEIVHALRAGTNCGLCVPELKKIIADELVLWEAV